jgi:DNA-binding transcriptional MerR regulator
MRLDALKVSDLARKTGVSVRTLHYYDEIGLLAPSQHTESGHRLYGAADVARLQQIKSLRQLGFSLEEIRDCLGRSDFSPQRVLRLHLSRLREQMALEQQLCHRLKALATQLGSAEAVSVEAFLQAIEVMTMMEKLYTPEQVKQFAEIAQQVGPEEIRAVEQAWLVLMAEVRANRDLDPASPHAQALGRRWEELTERTMRGYQAYPEVKQAIEENYKQGRFEGHGLAPQAADFAFIERVKAARQSGQDG